MANASQKPRRVRSFTTKWATAAAPIATPAIRANDPSAAKSPARAGRWSSHAVMANPVKSRPNGS
ncbi:MAG: hypothetical protein C0467_19150 [Planctomycetaceae bacterium]|nr:hypothetical protein [Planctomycetaceae bacterium]